MSSLYVGDLHPDVTSEMLYAKFSGAGPVTSVRVCRDMLTNRSLNYGYVNFENAEHAEMALDTLNFDTLLGQPMRIMFVQRDPTLRRNNVGNVYIRNLDNTIDTKKLYDEFSIFGDILSCKVPVDSIKMSMGYGFVHFHSEASADLAISSLNGTMMAGKPVFVSRFIPKHVRDKEKDDQRLQFKNIFIKNFGKDVDESMLQTMFGGFGEITSLKIMPIADNTPCGYAFISFVDCKAAFVAVEKMNNAAMADGRILYVGRAQKKKERHDELVRKYQELKMARQALSKKVNLFVKNLGLAVDDERLRKLFEKYGTITSAKVMMDGAVAKGFGFVCFSNPEEAKRAIGDLHGKIIVGHKPLYVAFAQTKDERVNIPSTTLSEDLIIPSIGGKFVPEMPSPQEFFGRHPTHQKPGTVQKYLTTASPPVIESVHPYYSNMAQQLLMSNQVNGSSNNNNPDWQMQPLPYAQYANNYSPWTNFQHQPSMGMVPPPPPPIQTSTEMFSMEETTTLQTNSWQIEHGRRLAPHSSYGMYYNDMHIRTTYI